MGSFISSALNFFRSRDLSTQTDDSLHLSAFNTDKEDDKEVNSPQVSPDQEAKTAHTGDVAAQSTDKERQSTSKPAIDRSIFVQRKKTDETIRRVNGEINGNQFIASDLTNCKVIVNDYVDSMTFDRCNNCEMILSAVKGSVFVRDCNDSKFILVCGQFRARHCNNCDFFMHVKTGPVIETSENCRIGCAELSYPLLYQHMERALIPLETNIWYDVHDFTPGEGHFTYVSGERLHFDFVENANARSMIPYIHMRDSGKSYFDAQTDEINEIINFIHKDGSKVIKITKNNDNYIFTFEASSLDDAKDQTSSIKVITIDVESIK